MRGLGQGTTQAGSERIGTGYGPGGEREDRDRTRPRRGTRGLGQGTVQVGNERIGTGYGIGGE